MIVDTHVHVWEIDPPKYPIGPTAPGWTSMPDEPGTADELLAEMDACGVDWSVLVQTSWSTWDDGYIAVPRPMEAAPGRMGAAIPALADRRYVACSLAEAEARAIQQALHLTGYNRAAAARLLNIHRSTLLRKIRLLGL